MAILTSFLPLLILVVIIGGGILVNRNVSKKPLMYQKSKWIFIGYVLLLVIASMFTFLLPTPDATIVKEEGNVDLSVDGHLYDMAQSGRFSEIAQEDIRKSWKFPFEDNSLSLDSPYNDISYLIEKTTDLDGKIEVYFLSGGQVVQVGNAVVDVSDYIPIVSIEINADALQFRYPIKNQEIAITYFEPAFPMQLMDQIDDGFSYAGSHFFYIRVPKDVEINYSEFLPVHFVGE